MNAPNETPKTNMKIGFYDVLCTIGHGNFSICKLAKHRIYDHKVAIKCLEKRNLDTVHLNRIYREIEIMKSLEHPNIIKLNQVMESKSMLYLVCEYAENGEIFDYISKNGAMNEKMACEKFCQILSAVEYCHLKNIAHRDLKSENLLLDANMNVKIADFGFANYFDLTNPLKTFCGSPPYAAPEIFCGKKYYGPEIDIWSLGVILYVLVSGCLPFDSENLQSLKARVLSCKYRIPYFMSSECENLLGHLLVVNSSKRYKLQQIKSHKWIKTFCSHYYYIFNNKSNSSATNNEIVEAGVNNKKNNDRIKSKSLKLVGTKNSRNIEASKKNSALSSLSLPLYSFEEYFNEPIEKQTSMEKNFTNNDEQNYNSDMKTTKHINSQLADCLNIESLGNNKQILKQMPDDLFIENQSKLVENTSNLKPSNLTNNLSIFAELFSNSSSLDEGVESGVSSPTASSSMSNDVLSSSITSCHSIQLPDSQTPTRKKSLLAQYTHQAHKKNSLPAIIAFNRKQKLLNSKKILKTTTTTATTPITTAPTNKNPTKPKNIYDLAQIKRELNYLITHNKPSDDANDFGNASKLRDEHVKQEKEEPQQTQQATSINLNEPSRILQKYKQLIFINNSKKFLYLVKRKTKQALFKQRSSSLNSLSEDQMNEAERNEQSLSCANEQHPKNKRKLSLSK